MEKFTSTPAANNTETKTGQVLDDTYRATTSGALMHDAHPLPEAAPELPSEAFAKLQQQKSVMTDRLNAEFWPEELDDASIFRTRDLLRKQANQSGVETNNDESDIPPRVREAMTINGQINATDTQIDQLYSENPELVENRIREILSTRLSIQNLAEAKQDSEYPGFYAASKVIGNDRELSSLLATFEKHHGYDKSKDVDTPETWSPKYDFVERSVSELIQEQAEKITAYEALSPEEKERYPDKQTVREKLSYQDADLSPEQLAALLRNAESRTTAEQYAHHLNKLPQAEVERVIPHVKGLAKKVLHAIGIPISPYGNSDSWVYWDLGKQQYYYEQHKDSLPPKSDRYTYAPALEKLDEIANRHVGWEFYHAPTEIREKVLAAIEDSHYLARVFAVLQNDPKADGQLPAHEYAELGAVLHEYARSKDTQENTADTQTVQREANFAGNDSLLLFERLTNPNILNQNVQMWMAGYQARAGKIEQRPKRDEHGNILFDADNNQILEDIPFVPPTEAEVREKIATLMDEITTSTPISFDERPPTSDNTGIFWKLPGNLEPTTKQKAIMLAHEKGHRVRQFPGGQEGEAYYQQMFSRAFDARQARYTEEDFAKDVPRLRQAYKAEGEDPGEAFFSFENFKNMALSYIARPEEIVERMGQLKNYFGFTADEEFTQQHLDYARKHYISDTGLDNNMRHFFESITNDQEFLKLINRVGA